ncbi:prenyltransferase/squalene oxidase repeat-containing protein [Evansella tamaricis]|uniref:Squalene--hopene cyclase n=1 Tax=Evansella tamaricis TaxID=2069301 RepID=A0ABS6JL75_9BACI|nr:prenyltransferase/squalene oxidase repeat-containing protein [Evansella tamaricis]MBU9714341.1 squalene--hopene cyclase [Evansella tamaricis]
MGFATEIQAYQQNKVQYLKRKQCPDGAWRFPCENGPITDAHMIIVLRVLGIEDNHLIEQLTSRILKTREQNGAWKLYPDEKEGNLSATIEAYTALLFSGKPILDETERRKTETFICERGGLPEAHVSTKFLLALNDLYPWPTVFPIPLSLLSMPTISPVRFDDMTSYVKTHFAPILITANKRFSVRTKWTPNLDHLINDANKRKRLERQRTGKPTFLQRLKTIFFPKHLNRKWLKRAERYVVSQIETDGTLGSYATATYYMIYCLLALGYSRSSAIITGAIQGLKGLGTFVDSEFHIQNARSTIWDTALVTSAIQAVGEGTEFPVRKGCQFLINHKVLCEKGTISWGFSENNSDNPDVDDTQVALRSLSPFLMQNKEAYDCWHKGVRWILEMQNADGGWSSFEKNKGKSLITKLPIENMKDTAIDPSTPDLTGRVLEFLGNYGAKKVGNPQVDAAVKFLKGAQREDGSWYGRWGVCYLYGTWAAVTGLMAVGVPKDDPVIQNAVRWLISKQNHDGGWGESCQSDVRDTFVPLEDSTPSQTAWAVDTLVSVLEKPSVELIGGVRFLLDEKGNWLYPTGAGLPGNFYLRYHSYNHIWPLIALTHYLNKYRWRTDKVS